MWRPGHKLVHPFNTDLGTGLVRAVDGRFLQVWFPTADAELRLSAKDGGLRRFVVASGAEAVILSTGEEVQVERAVPAEDCYVLEDGRTVPEADLWPMAAPDTPVESLAAGRFGGLRAFRNRIEGLDLMSVREAGGLGSFLGGRIELFPHQLHTALAATSGDPVRWLLADEVGLGKTIEACLVLSALARTGRAERALVIAPETLVVQWLGELWRKFNQLYVLLDEERIDSVAAVFGDDVNPFDVHPFAVASMEAFSRNSRLVGLARAAGLDVVVVDEAHRLVGGPAHAAVAPLVEAAHHAMLLTATPLSADREGFHELLTILHGDKTPPLADFDNAIEAGDAVLKCVSAVRRVDVGGLPPRVPQPVDIDPPGGDLREDSRTRWLVDAIPAWALAEDKVLVFVPDVDELQALQKVIEQQTRHACGVFHERLSADRRDVELARFRAAISPVLLCSEAGEEGRNFQFCDRMVHWELPRNPVALEQRIGRLDRIGRRGDVEIVYFRHPGSRHAQLFEALGLFDRPSAGLDAALSGVAPALAAAERGDDFDFDALVETVAHARQSVEDDVARVLYADAYDGSQEDEILDLVPPDLDDLVRSFVLNAAEDVGMGVVEKGNEVWYLELGSHMKIDGLPGVPEDARYLGTFDRANATERPDVDFIASGHPLLEGLLLELEDGRRGRAAVLEVPHAEFSEPGLLGLFRDGPSWSSAAVDARGRPRPDLAQAVLEGLEDAKALRPDDAPLGPAWADGIRGLADRLDAPGKMVAVAFFTLKGPG